jgi:uncharacterized membrane protein
MPGMSWLGRFGHNERGGVAIMAAAFGLLICALTAFAVDLGSIVLTTRHVQSTADLAALSAARDLPKAQAAAEATARANLDKITRMTVKKGRYVPDPALTPETRFTEQASQINAARVEITSSATLFFGRVIVGSSQIPITRKATAALPHTEPRVMFSIGSRLASLNDGLVNALLKGLLGTEVNVSAVSYEDLADVNVNLLQFSNALATELGVKAGDYDALLKHETKAGTLLKVLERVTGSKNSALATIAAVPLDVPIKLGDLVGVEAEAREGLAQHLNANVTAMDLMTATLQTANGKRQLELDLDLFSKTQALKKLASVKTYVAIGERPNNSPWLTITSKGEPVISTAQARVYLKVTALDAIEELAAVKIPIFIEVAGAQAKLDSITCSPAPSTVLKVKTGLARVVIGEVDPTKLKNFKVILNPTKAYILDALGSTVLVTALADVNVGDNDFQNVTFVSSDVGKKDPKKVKSTHFLSGTVSSLLTNLQLTLDISLLGPVVKALLNLVLSGLLQTIAGILAPLTAPLDELVQSLLGLLGIKLGEADLWVHAIECGQNKVAPKLVG